MKYLKVCIDLLFFICLFSGCSKQSNPVASGGSETWTQCQGLPNLTITGFAASGNNLVCGTYNMGLSMAYIYISFDNGLNWSLDTTFKVFNKLPFLQLYLGTPVTFLTYDGYVFAGIGGAYKGTIYRSSDNGVTWSSNGISWP